MAVWTTVSNEALDSFLQHYHVGTALAFKPIAEGVENSNYFLQTQQGDFILTLYERRVDEKDLPFFLGLMNHLAEAGLSVATAIAQKSGALFGVLEGQPTARTAALIQFLPGRWHAAPRAHHCRLFGEALAKLHLAAASFPHKRENKMGAAYWTDLLQSCQGIDQSRTQLLQKEIATLQPLMSALGTLPSGIIHGDGFPDNALFNGDQISIIDFYFACYDSLALDIAIALNAWCWHPPSDSWHTEKAHALLEGYQSARQLNTTEHAALPLLCRASALRFLLTRTADKILLEQHSAAQVFPKDPDEYLALLAFHQKAGAIL